MKVNVGCKVEPEVKTTLEKEAVEKGFKNINNYLPAIIENRHNTGGTEEGFRNDPELEKRITELESELTKWKNQAKAALDNMKEMLEKEKSLNALPDHFAKRAWDIARIDREKLEKGFPKM